MQALRNSILTLSKGTTSGFIWPSFFAWSSLSSMGGTFIKIGWKPRRRSRSCSRSWKRSRENTSKCWCGRISRKRNRRGGRKKRFLSWSKTRPRGTQKTQLRSRLLKGALKRTLQSPQATISRGTTATSLEGLTRMISILCRSDKKAISSKTLWFKMRSKEGPWINQTTLSRESAWLEGHALERQQL